FADILLIIEPMGLELEFAKGEGPVIHNPIRTAQDIARVREVETVDALDYVMQAIRVTRRELRPDIPLIGFSGAPFTLASYIIEGGGSRNYVHTKTLMYTDSGAWHALMSLVARALTKYLNAQIAAGAQAVQLFDSWVGCLSPDDYREYVLPHVRSIIQNITPGTPVIHFGTGTSTLLELMREAGGDVLGLDWRIDLAEGWQRTGHDRAIMGNLDPVTLFAFGGPEAVDEVLPFLANVLRGRNVPPERMRTVAQHYELFGGVSPINEQNRKLIAALQKELDEMGPRLPIYWGNRNWHPLLADTLRQMRDDGIRRALAFVTSAYSSYSGCRQYRENIEQARAEVGDDAPQVEKLRAFYNHPGFIEPNIEHL